MLQCRLKTSVLVMSVTCCVFGWVKCLRLCYQINLCSYFSVTKSTKTENGSILTVYLFVHYKISLFQPVAALRGGYTVRSGVLFYLTMGISMVQLRLQLAVSAPFINTTNLCLTLDPYLQIIHLSSNPLIFGAIKTSSFIKSYHIYFHPSYMITIYYF